MNNILLSNKEKVTFIKTNKGNFTATLIRFNQNLNYEKIYVFRIANVKLVFELCKYICDKILYLTYF